MAWLVDIVAKWIALVLCAAYVVVSCSGCGRAKEPDQAEPTDDVRTAYVAAEDQGNAMADRGLLVSRWKDGTAEHTGDAGTFSGEWMAFTDCEHGAAAEDALVSIMAEDGRLARHFDLVDKVSVDVAVGVYRGIARRLSCPGSADKWREPFRKHLALGPKLNPKSSTVLPKEFTYVRDLIGHRLGLVGEPHADRLTILETQVVGWATATKTARAACFRINLGYQTLRTVAALGVAISAPGRALFCQATDGTDIPTVDAFCGRRDLGDYIAAYTPNEWDYRHQRCGAWETPDGKPGLMTSPLGLVEAYAEKYAL